MRYNLIGQDITTNLPYAKGVHLAFNHHMSETHHFAPHENLIIDAEAPSPPGSSTGTTAARPGFPNSPPRFWPRWTGRTPASSPERKYSTRRGGSSCTSCWICAPA